MKTERWKNSLRRIKELRRLWRESELLGGDKLPGKESIMKEIKDKIGWVSPTYFQSRTVQLNPLVLEKNRCVAAFADKQEIDSYKILRQQLTQAIEDRGGNAVMVTSSFPGEGKTLTSINLAFTFAREFEQTVLLVDCDLKKQNIHRVLGYESQNGLVNYLLNECNMTDVIVWPSQEKLTIISGGKVIQESSEVLGSSWMKELVFDMKSRYPERIVIFDLPPVLAAADAMIFSRLMDHIVVVVEADKTAMSDLKAALQMLPKEKIAGVVLNRIRSEAMPKYNYAYTLPKKVLRKLPIMGS